MKILKRNYGHRNLILFLVLSLFYLQAIYSLSIGRSVFSFLSFKSFLTNQYIILILSVVAGYMVLKIKKFSEYALLVCLVVIVGKNFILLSDSFNKLILVLNFIYLLFAFYFYITWDLEVGFASFNPKFSNYDLEKESRFRINANISTRDFRYSLRNAKITNLDEGSCFLLLEEKIHLNSKEQYFLESVFEGVCFRHQARVVSHYGNGIGLVFENAPEERFSWTELYKVCLERGIMN